MITTLTGENSLGLQTELRRLINEFVQAYGDLAVTPLDGEEVSYDRLYEALQSMPFLVDKKLAVLRTPSAQKEFAENVQDLLENVGESIDIIVVEPKLDKRSSYYKYLKAHTTFKEFHELDANGLARWVVARAKEEGGTISTADARYLVERSGINQQLLDQELQKLVIYEPAVTRQNIDLLTEPAPQSTIFQLLDAMFAGNTKQAVRLYEEQRQLKVEPQQIIAMLAWQLHILALVKSAVAQSDALVASSAKLNPYVVSKTRTIAGKLSMRDIQKLVSEVLDIDLKSKTKGLNSDEALRNLLVAGVTS